MPGLVPSNFVVSAPVNNELDDQGQHLLLM